MRNKKLLVTGGAGYIGSHVVRQLGAAGEDVITLDNLSTGFAAAVTAGELIVGERGHRPKATPTYPEITCHSADDLRILDTRAMTSYHVAAEDIEIYEREVIPFWRGRSLRDRVFDRLPEDWHQAFSAGVFTEFLEQRAPGHTVADGKIYLVSREAGTYVLSAGPKFEQLAHNVIEGDDSIFNASLVVSRGQLLLRSDKYLYCIGAR